MLLCVEILSPDDHLGAMLAKCEQYHEWGVSHCWVIDPVKRTAWEYPASGDPGRVNELHAAEATLSVQELFAQLTD